MALTGSAIWTSSDAINARNAANALVSIAPPMPSRDFLRTVFVAVNRGRPCLSQLPNEIAEIIIDMVIVEDENWLSHLTSSARTPTRHPALTPPRTGASPFMSLPTEMRRYIFAESLSDHDQAFHPLCDNKDADVRKKHKLKDPQRKVDKNAHTIFNLMTINRKICGELSQVMYEERTFVIHVHEGLKTGGVEILHAGRQPLQYQDCTEDKRFAKFMDGEKFGFQRMKKIVVQIFPTTEDQDRHVAINTHFINLALCRLLERPNNEKERITIIKIEFAHRQTPATDRMSRAAIIRHEKPWMDVDGPRQSSIHNVSDIEIALRPFAMLTRCHNASVELPPYLADDEHLASFAANLEQSMMSKTGTLMPNDTLEYKVEQLRYEMEAHVRALFYGNGNRTEVAKLTDKEMADEDAGDGESDVDEGVALDNAAVSARTRSKKHPRDADGAGKSLSALKRKRGLTEGGGQEGKGGSGWKSFLDDAMLLDMSDDVHFDLAIQLSEGKTRKQLGLKDAGEDDDDDDDDDDDWKLDLIKKYSEGEISEEMLQAMGVMVPSSDTDSDAAAPPLGAPEIEMPATRRGTEATGKLEPVMEGLMVDIEYGSPNTSTTATDAAAVSGVAQTATPEGRKSKYVDIYVGNAADPLDLSYYGQTWSTTYNNQPPTTSASLPGAAAMQQNDTSTPRTLVQAEDSGIGMLASEGGEPSQQDGRDEKIVADVDEEMFDAFMIY